MTFGMPSEKCAVLRKSRLERFFESMFVKALEDVREMSLTNVLPKEPLSFPHSTRALINDYTGLSKNPLSIFPSVYVIF